MNILMINKPIEAKNLKPFTPVFDEIFISTNEDFQENNEFELKEKNIQKLFDILNFSWDGEIYWFKKKYEHQILAELKIWFAKEENHPEFDFDLGIGNCFLVKKTEHCFAIIDTQLDVSSNLFNFIKHIKSKIQDVQEKCYSDCHLIDHLYLGRNSNEDEFENLYFLYKEKIIDSSFFLKGLTQINLEDYQKPYFHLISQEKEIVISGKLPLPREAVKDDLKYKGFKVSEKITENSWLWLGEDVGKEKIKKAQEKNIKISTIDELIEESYQKYLKNKEKIKNNQSKHKL